MENNTYPSTEIQPYEIPTELVYRPRIDLTISRDSGRTWSNTVSKDLNPIGERENIVNFNRLGRANDLTFQFRFWGRCDFIVANGVLQVY